MSDLSYGLEEEAALIGWYVGVWHDLGYENPPAPGCKAIPPLGERSPAAIEGAHAAIREIGILCGRLGRLREQLEGELLADEAARQQKRSETARCAACGNPVVPGPKTLYDVAVKRGDGSDEVVASAVPIREVQALRRKHPGAGVAVHMLAEGSEVHFSAPGGER